MINCITINTDASYCRKTKVGGYAFYIRSDSFKLQKGGAFREKVESPIDAETMAVCNALYVLLNEYHLPKVNFIVINTDCTGVIDRIEKRKEDYITRYLLQLIDELKKITGCNVRVKHVKAHVNIKDSRSYVNDWCDKTAKTYMRIARKNINK